MRRIAALGGLGTVEVGHAPLDVQQAVSEGAVDSAVLSNDPLPPLGKARLLLERTRLLHPLAQVGALDEQLPQAFRVGCGQRGEEARSAGMEVA